MKDLKTVLNEVFKNSDLNPVDFIVDANDYNDDLEGLKNYLSEARGFINENDIIYYSEAIKYLAENDNSLKESLEIASEYGFTLEKLNSEILASLLYQRNLRDEFEELWAEVETAMEGNLIWCK